MSTWPARFAGVVVRPQTWLNTLYLLLAFPFGLAYFVVLVVGVSTGAALAVLIVGLGILLATLAAWRGMAAIERAWPAPCSACRSRRPADQPALPPHERILRWLRDPMTWKGLVFVALKFPLGVASFAIVCSAGFFSLVLLFSPLIVLGTTVTFFGWIVESPLQALPLTVIGIPAVLLALHLFNGAAWLWAIFARVMLGPSTVAAARAGRRPARLARPHPRRRRRRAPPDRA